MSVQIAPDALNSLHNYRKAMVYDLPSNPAVDETKSPACARLGTMAFKIAMLLAAIATPEGNVRIDVAHAYAAQLICERWRESLHRLDMDIARSGNTIQDKVLAYLKCAGTEGVTAREIIRDCAIKTGRAGLTDILNILADENLVEQYDKKPAGAGRPTKKFRYVKNAE